MTTISIRTFRLNRLEKASDYEKRVIEIIHYQFPEHQRLDTNELK